jgi:hypothetical protein
MNSVLNHAVFRTLPVTYCKSLYICLTFMIRVNPIRSFTGHLMIFIFLASIVCSSASLVGWLPSNIQEVIAVKKSTTPSKSDSQLPEKVEVENDLKSNNHFFFIQEICEFIQSDITKSQSAFIYNAFRFRGNTAGTPLYLVKRSILI